MERIRRRLGGMPAESKSVSKDKPKATRSGRQPRGRSGKRGPLVKVSVKVGQQPFSMAGQYRWDPTLRPSSVPSTQLPVPIYATGVSSVETKNEYAQTASEQDMAKETPFRTPTRTLVFAEPESPES